jgi:hypothetical protein
MSSVQMVQLNQRHLPHCLIDAADPLLSCLKCMRGVAAAEAASNTANKVAELTNVSLFIFDTKHAINDQTY